MEMIFLIGFIQALFFAVLLINKKAKTLSDMILPVWLFILGLHLLLLFFLYKSIFKEYHIFIILHLSLPLIHFPLFYLYVNTLVNKINKFKAGNFLHFIPFFVFIIFYLVFANNDLLYSYDFLHSNNIPHNIIHFNLIINIISGFIYLTLCLIQLNKFNKKIKEYYSNIDKIQLKWLAHLIVGIWIVLMTGILYIMATRWFQTELNYSIDFFMYGSLTIFIFFIGYYSSKKTYLVTRVELNNDTKPDTTIKEADKNNLEEHNKYHIYGLKKKEAGKLKDKLIVYIEKNKPYLESNLSLSQLADSLDIYKHYLTQVLNDELKTNFYDFINNYRVEEVKRLITEDKHKHYTLLAIALEAGFNSKSSFNRIFKKITGFTPSQYKNQYKEQV